MAQSTPTSACRCTPVGVACSTQGRLEEAESYSVQAFEVWELALGPNHPSVRIVLYNRAGVAAVRGQGDRVLTLPEQASDRGWQGLATAQDPYFESVTGSPAFVALVQRIGHHGAIDERQTGAE